MIPPGLSKYPPRLPPPSHRRYDPTHRVCTCIQDAKRRRWREEAYVLGPAYIQGKRTISFDPSQLHAIISAVRRMRQRQDRGGSYLFGQHVVDVGLIRRSAHAGRTGRKTCPTKWVVRLACGLRGARGDLPRELVDVLAENNK